jgi:2-hydroxycyclohexanecarboxyl-CoA dehydrogenase
MGTAIVTGAASGIGRATAKRLAKRMTVVAADRDAAGLADTVGAIEAAGGNAIAIKVDVTSGQSVRDMIAQVDAAVEATGDPVEAALFAAGIFIKGPVDDITEDDWDRMMDTHVKGTFLCCQAVLARMVKRGIGAIVTMSSDFAVMAVPDGAAYCAAKSAIYSMTKSLALEFAGNGIRVNALGPGPIDTPILRSGRSEAEYQAARVSIAARLPLGRLGQPEDVAAAADFLLSERAGYINGQIIHPNGGQQTW